MLETPKSAKTPSTGGIPNSCATSAILETVRLVQSPLSRIAEAAQELGIPPVDGVLADLGVSSMQLGSAARGFSFREGARLDMRMDAVNGQLTADEIVNRWSEREIADLLYREADEHDSRRIAKAIVRARPIRDTAHLATTVAGARREWGRQRLHPATKTLLALRIRSEERRVGKEC